MNRTFNHIKDRHFPEGYPNIIQEWIDNSVQKFLNRITEKFDLNEIKIIFDIGSLNGIESVKFSEKLPNSNIHTFEPNPESFNNVLISTKDINNIKVYNLALSNFEGESKFYITHDNMGASSLLEPLINNPKTNHYSLETIVNVRRVDKFCLLHKIKKIDIMWIDVQGSELNIFRGMGDMLNETKAIYVECSMIPYYHQGPKKDEIIEYLSEFNFELIDETHHDMYEGDFMFIKKI